MPEKVQRCFFEAETNIFAEAKENASHIVKFWKSWSFL
jgi:hypothetical protein